MPDIRFSAGYRANAGYLGNFRISGKLPNIRPGNRISGVRIVSISGIWPDIEKGQISGIRSDIENCRISGPTLVTSLPDICVYIPLGPRGRHR